MSHLCARVCVCACTAVPSCVCTPTTASSCHCQHLMELPGGQHSIISVAPVNSAAIIHCGARAQMRTSVSVHGPLSAPLSCGVACQHNKKETSANTSPQRRPVIGERGEFLLSSLRRSETRSRADVPVCPWNPVESLGWSPHPSPSPGS